MNAFGPLESIGHKPVLLNQGKYKLEQGDRIRIKTDESYTEYYFQHISADTLILTESNVTI